MDKELFLLYAEYKNQIKELEEKVKELQPQVMGMMQLADTERVETEVGTFSLSLRKTWKYTDEVESLKEQLDGAKATEEATGAATYTEKPSLMFTATKE